MGILDEIREQKLLDVAAAKERASLDELRRAARAAAPTRGFARVIEEGPAGRPRPAPAGRAQKARHKVQNLAPGLAEKRGYQSG